MWRWCFVFGRQTPSLAYRAKDIIAKGLRQTKFTRPMLSQRETEVASAHQESGCRVCGDAFTCCAAGRFAPRPYWFSCTPKFENSVFLVPSTFLLASATTFIKNESLTYLNWSKSNASHTLCPCLVTSPDCSTRRLAQQLAPAGCNHFHCVGYGSSPGSGFRSNSLSLPLIFPSMYLKLNFSRLHYIVYNSTRLINVCTFNPVEHFQGG